MTISQLDYDPNDTGDIPLGETTVRIPGETRMRIDTGEATQRIDPDTIKLIVGAPSFTAIPRRVIDATDTVVFHIPETIGLAGPDQPKPPSPLPPPPTKLDPETGVNIFGGLGTDLPEAPFPGYVGRHRHAEDQAVVADERHWLSPWGAVALIAVVGLAIWVGLTLAAAAVIW